MTQQQREAVAHRNAFGFIRAIRQQRVAVHGHAGAGEDVALPAHDDAAAKFDNLRRRRRRRGILREWREQLRHRRHVRLEDSSAATTTDPLTRKRESRASRLARLSRAAS